MGRRVRMQMTDAPSQLGDFEFVRTPTARTLDELGMKCPICGREPNSKAHDSSHSPSSTRSAPSAAFGYYAMPITDEDRDRRDAYREAFVDSMTSAN